MEPLQTPSPSHAEFDQMCAKLDDFEPLPSLTVRPLEREPQDEEATSLDDQILVGLVLPL